MHHHAPISSRLRMLSFGLASPGKPFCTRRDFTGRPSSSSTTEWNQWRIFRGSDSSTVSWSHDVARLAPFDNPNLLSWHVSMHGWQPDPRSNQYLYRTSIANRCPLQIAQWYDPGCRSIHRISEVLLYFNLLCQSLLCTAESQALGTS